jgi:hypothetical protein
VLISGIFFADVDASPFLAYVKWFSLLPAAPDPKHKLFKATRMTQNGRRSASVIELDNVLGSVHLFPRFGATSPQEWNQLSYIITIILIIIQLARVYLSLAVDLFPDGPGTVCRVLRERT